MTASATEKTTPNKVARPLSPHLGIYKPQLTSGMSILHRVTGIGLWLGLPVFSVWLLAIAKGPEAYYLVMDLLKTHVAQALLLGWTFAFFYHFFNGIRYLLLGTGKLLTLKFAYRSGYLTLVATFAATALLWGIAKGMIE